MNTEEKISPNLDPPLVELPQPQTTEVLTGIHELPKAATVNHQGSDQTETQFVPPTKIASLRPETALHLVKIADSEPAALVSSRRLTRPEDIIERDGTALGAGDLEDLVARLAA